MIVTIEQIEQYIKKGFMIALMSFFIGLLVGCTSGFLSAFFWGQSTQYEKRVTDNEKIYPMLEKVHDTVLKMWRNK